MAIKIGLIMIGGALGAVMRYGVSVLAHKAGGDAFPWGTLAVNLIGAFLIGFLYHLFERSTFSPEFRIFLFVGVLGAFTTFSTFSMETINLFRDGQMKLALVYVGMTNFVGIASAVLGFAASRSLVR